VAAGAAASVAKAAVAVRQAMPNAAARVEIFMFPGSFRNESKVFEPRSTGVEPAKLEAGSYATPRNRTRR
jgi:hypothetical protein